MRLTITEGSSHMFQTDQKTSISRCFVINNKARVMGHVKRKTDVNLVLIAIFIKKNCA